MSTTKFKKALACTLISCLLIVLLFLATARHMIVQGLDAAISRAQTAQPDSANKIAALVNYVKSDNHSLKNRNSAVWALGQLRDGQALETLKELVQFMDSPIADPAIIPSYLVAKQISQETDIIFFD